MALINNNRIAETKKIIPAQTLNQRPNFSKIIVNPGAKFDVTFLKNWSLLYPDGRTPVLSPAYDFVATFPYIPGDTLALSFGGSQRLGEITVDQIRRFADTARLPVSPVARIVREMMERTAAAWKTLDQKDILPSEMRRAIDKQIHGVIAKTHRTG